MKYSYRIFSWSIYIRRYSRIHYSGDNNTVIRSCAVEYFAHELAHTTSKHKKDSTPALMTVTKLNRYKTNKVNRELNDWEAIRQIGRGIKIRYLRDQGRYTESIRCWRTIAGIDCDRRSFDFEFVGSRPKRHLIGSLWFGLHGEG